MKKTFWSYLIALSRVVTGICIFFTPVQSYLCDVLFILNGSADIFGELLFALNNTKYSMDKALNSVGTVLFIIAGSIKFMPKLLLSSTIYVWLIIIAVFVIWNSLSEYIIYGRVIYVNSIVTRIVKILLYLFPVLTRMIATEFLLIVICAFSTFAEIQIGHLVRMKTTEKQILGLDDNN